LSKAPLSRSHDGSASAETLARLGRGARAAPGAQLMVHRSSQWQRRSPIVWPCQLRHV